MRAPSAPARRSGISQELDGSEPLAIVKGNPGQAPAVPTVGPRRVHSEAFTAMPSARSAATAVPSSKRPCDDSKRPARALLVYLRQEGPRHRPDQQVQGLTASRTAPSNTVEHNERARFAARSAQLRASAPRSSAILGVRRTAADHQQPAQDRRAGGLLQVETGCP